MKKIKKIIIAFLVLGLFQSMIFAAFGMDMSVSYQPMKEDSNGATIENPYPVNLVLLPSYEKDNFLMELRVPLALNIGSSSEDFSIDSSLYEIPEKLADDSNTDYILSVIDYYLGFISYIQYGYNWEDFHIRVGKLTNSTVGDGALISHYGETKIKTFETRPGFQIKLDGRIFNFGLLGFEGISNDMFNPDFYGGRLFVRPFNFTDWKFIEDTSFGFTIINNNYTSADNIDYTTNYNSYSFDINQSLLLSDNYSLALYYDIISDKTTENLEAEDSSRSISWRMGLNGRYFKKMIYDVYFKSFVKDSLIEESSNASSQILEMFKYGSLPLINGNYQVYGSTGYYTLNGSSYIIGETQFNYTDYSLNNYFVGLKAVSNKPILIFNNFSLGLKKTYIFDEVTQKPEESFFDGLLSIKNVALSVQSDIQYGISVFSVGVQVTSDENKDISTLYNFGYRISLF